MILNQWILKYVILHYLIIYETNAVDDYFDKLWQKKGIKSPKIPQPNIEDPLKTIKFAVKTEETQLDEVDYFDELWQNNGIKAPKITQPNMKDPLNTIKFEIKTEETQLDEGELASKVKIEAIDEDELLIQKTDSFEEECSEEEEELNSNCQDDKILKKLKIYKKAKQSNPNVSDAYIAKTLLRITEHTLYNWKKKFGIQKKRHSPKEISKIMQLYVAMKERTSEINDDDFADEFGISRRTLIKWKNDFGLEKALTFYNDKEIQTILKNYSKIKSKCPDIRASEIAKKFGINSKTLLRWKKQCGYKSKQINSYKPDEKFEIIRQYKELIKGKDSTLHDYELAKKLNIHRTTLMRWKSEFGLNSRKLYSDEDKNKILQKYYKLKKRQPELSETKIAKQLSVNRRSLKNWKTEFGNQQTFEHGNSGSNQDDAISFHDEDTKTSEESSSDDVTSSHEEDGGLDDEIKK